VICSVLAGMNTTLWMRLPVASFVIAELVPTQDIDGELWPEWDVTRASCRDPYVHVIGCGGRLWLEDGHHRRARALARGRTLIDGRYLHCASTALHTVPSLR
jgi:hypothetical protein